MCAGIADPVPNTVIIWREQTFFFCAEIKTKQVVTIKQFFFRVHDL